MISYFKSDTKRREILFCDYILFTRIFEQNWCDVIHFHNQEFIITRQ